MKHITLTLIIITLYSCSKTETLFKLLDSEQTGVDFNNKITETTEFNILTDEYIFNGGGVAVADFDKNGLPDLFFTGNMVSNELYLNQGDLKFKKVTEQAKLDSSHFWSSGVAAVDINSDGLMDIYVASSMQKGNRENRLYINQGNNNEGIPIFKEEAKNYGIDDSSNTMGVAFIDFDRDGDLDLYVLIRNLQC